MRRALLALLLVAGTAQAQWQNVAGTWQRVDGKLGAGGFPAVTTGTLTSGRVPVATTGGVLTDDAGLTYSASTDSLTVAGKVTAGNVTATALAAPTITSVTPVLSKIATITTVAGASLVDGDYFTIKYDTGLTVPVEFDLSPGDGTTGGRVPLLFTAGDSADTVRDNIISLLNAAAPTKLLASSGGAATVNIVLLTPGAAGDTNTENVANAGFAVTGFVNPTAATTYGYKIQSCLNDTTCTAATAESTTAAGHATLSAANFNRIVFVPSTGSAYTKLYRTTGGTTGRLIYSGTATSYDDVLNTSGTSETPATANTTGLLSGYFADGTAAAPSIGAVASAPSVGWWAPVPGTITFAAGGASRISLSLGSLIFGSAGQILMGNWSEPTAYSILTALSRPADYTWQLGPANSAAPIDYTLRVMGGAGTDIKGGMFTLQGGNSTGAGIPGPVVVQTGYPSTTSSTLNAYGTRQFLSPGWTTLTESSATPVATLTYPASTAVGARFFVTIEAADATDRQSMSYEVQVNSVRKATGNTVTTVGVIGTPPAVASTSATTLTATFTATEGAGAVTLNANAVSSLTQTVLRANFQAVANGAGLVVAPVGF